MNPSGANCDHTAHTSVQAASNKTTRAKYSGAVSSRNSHHFQFPCTYRCRCEVSICNNAIKQKIFFSSAETMNSFARYDIVKSDKMGR